MITGTTCERCGGDGRLEAEDCPGCLGLGSPPACMECDGEHYADEAGCLNCGATRVMEESDDRS